MGVKVIDCKSLDVVVEAMLDKFDGLSKEDVMKVLHRMCDEGLLDIVGDVVYLTEFGRLAIEHARLDRAYRNQDVV